MGWMDAEEVGKAGPADYPELWAEIGRVLPALGDYSRRIVLALVTRTCPHCFAASRSVCYCMRDD